MKPLKTLFLKDDALHQVHHHSGDDRRNFLVDTETGETVKNVDQANRIALDRLKRQFGPGTFKRRALLMGGGVGAFSLSSMMLAQSEEARYAYSDAPLGDGTVFVMIYLRGGADGLSLVTPFNDPYYLQQRKTTRKTPNMAGAQKISNTFMLAPELAGLRQAWVAGDLSIAHSVGIDKNTRSHFSNYENADRSAPVQYKTGWLARLLDSTPDNQSQFRGFSHSSRVAGAFYGSDRDILAMNSFADFRVESNAKDDAISGVAARIANSVGGSLASTAQNTLNAMNEVQQLTASGYAPENGANYGNSSLGQSMKNIAQIIKADKGVQVVTVDHGDWDTHRGQKDRVNTLAKQLGDALGAFYQDMGSLRMQKVVVMTVSEFGRTTIENASQGTDHGAGNFSFILSGKATGKIAGGEWAGLKNEKDKDNMIQTDYRSLAAEVMSKGLGIDSKRIAQILPEFTPKPVGVLA